MRLKYLKSIVLLLVATTTYITFGQKDGNNSDKVIIEIGKNKITASELQSAYKKNNSRTNDNLFKLSKDSIMDFINLYSNFKLKVTDAIERGLLKDSSVQTEIQQNRKILAENFYYEKVLIEPNVSYAAKMREKEFLFSIILANIKQNATEIDTTDAFRKITNAMNRIKNGDSFEQVAKEFSDDYETGKNGGLVAQYITSGKMQRPIENAIFKTPEGQVYPEIVKTNYGYFLIKVNKIEQRKLVKGSHILININETRDSAAAYKTIDSLLQLLKKGADFSKIAKENSDDLSTAVNGGSLGGYYSRSTGMESSAYPLVSEFETALFKLNDGEYSGIIKSNYGFHIAKRDSTKLPDLKAEFDELKKLYKRLYFKLDQINLNDSLLKITKFKLYDDVLYQFTSFLDTNATNVTDNWSEKVPDRIKEYILFEHLGKKVNLSHFIDILSKDPKFRGAALSPSGIKRSIYTYCEPEALTEVTKNLEKDYKDFETSFNEFKNGILLFKLEAQEVWDKMKFDSVLAKSYYDSTKSRYITETAYDVSEIYFLDKNTADSVYKRLMNGEDFDDLASKETQRSGFREKKGLWGKVNVKTNTLAREANDKNAKKGVILPPFVNEPGYSIIRINDFFPPRQKTFEEAISDFSGQYHEMLQQKLTKIWLDKVRKKHPVKINEKELNKIISENK